MVSLCSHHNYRHPIGQSNSHGQTQSQGVGMLVGFFQRNKTDRIFTYVFTYYKELAHVIIKADKSQILKSASWRPREADDIVLLQKPAGFSRPRKSWRSSSSLMAGKNWCPSSIKSGGRSSLICRMVGLFVLFGLLPDRMNPIHIGGGNLLYSVYWFKW